jgi:predicted RNase H-like nuclease (RuvC/YqgF family)
MESEALRNIRTMRQVKTSLEVAGNQRIKTTSSLSKTTKERERLESLGIDNSLTAKILAKEKARAATFEASVERSRQKLLKSREKMANLINRNRALTRLRHEIQKDRDQTKESPSLSNPLVKREATKHGSLRGIELKY